MRPPGKPAEIVRERDRPYPHRRSNRLRFATLQRVHALIRFSSSSVPPFALLTMWSTHRAEGLERPAQLGQRAVVPFATDRMLLPKPLRARGPCGGIAALMGCASLAILLPCMRRTIATLNEHAAAGHRAVPEHHATRSRPCGIAGTSTLPIAANRRLLYMLGAGHQIVLTRLAATDRTGAQIQPGFRYPRYFRYVGTCGTSGT